MKIAMANSNHDRDIDSMDDEPIIGPMEVGYVFATIPFFIFVAALVVAVVLSYM